MTDDTISRAAALKGLEDLNIASFYELNEHSKEAYTEIKAMLKSLPSAQPETAKRIVGKSRDGMTLWYQCDMCNEPVDVQDNYCRECGRRLIDERSD